MLDPNDLRLSTLMLEMRDEGWETPDYRKFAQGACNGKFPATQHNGLWYGNRRDKARIATAMRMKRRTSELVSVG